MRWSNDMTVVTLFRVVEIFDLFDVSSFFLSVDAMCVCTVRTYRAFSVRTLAFQKECKKERKERERAEMTRRRHFGAKLVQVPKLSDVQK